MASSITMPNFAEMTILQPISIKVILWGDERAYNITQEMKSISNIEATYIPQIFYPSEQIFKIIDQYKNKMAPDQYLYLCPMVDVEECLCELNWFINDDAVSYSLPLHPVNLQKRDTELRRILEKLQGQNQMKLVNVCPGPISWERNCIYKAESINGITNVNPRAPPYNTLSETFASARINWNEQLMMLSKLYEKHHGASKNVMHLFSYVSLITEVRESAYFDWANNKGLFPVKGYWKRDGVFPTKQINDWLLHKWMGKIEDVFRENHQNPRKYLYKKGFSRPPKQEADQFNSEKRQNTDHFYDRGITPLSTPSWNDKVTKSTINPQSNIQSNINTKANVSNDFRPQRTPPSTVPNSSSTETKQPYSSNTQGFESPRGSSAPNAYGSSIQIDQRFRSFSAERPSAGQLQFHDADHSSVDSTLSMPVSSQVSQKEASGTSPLIHKEISGTSFQYDEMELPLTSSQQSNTMEHSYKSNYSIET